MITTIPIGELRWFQQWIENDEPLPPLGPARQMVFLHPGTRWVSKRGSLSRLPYVNGPDDERSSTDQQLTLEEALQSFVDPHTKCSFALYAGFLREMDRGLSDGFDEPAGTWHFGRLNYVLFSGELHESGYSGVDARWGSGRPFVAGAPFPMVELSYLWTEDHTVFVASPPDTAATFVRGPDALIRRLLEAPGLDAREWPSAREPA